MITTFCGNSIRWHIALMRKLHFFIGKGVGEDDTPRGEGYSPGFLFWGHAIPIPVRFMNFTGKWNKISQATVTLYNQLGPSNCEIKPGISFDIIVGNTTVGKGNVLTELKNEAKMGAELCAAAGATESAPAER